MTGHELEQNQSVPDLVVGRGGPAPVPPSGPPSPASPQPRWIVPALVVFLVGPVAIAAIVRLVTSRGPWSPLWQLWIIALIALFAATRFLAQAQKLQGAHSPRVQLREFEDENLQLSIGIAFGVIAEFVVVASFELWAGLTLIGLVLAWTLLWSLPALRRIEIRSSIRATCTPEAAFALVSDPQSWRLWTPELELVELSETPVRLGTVVRSGTRVQGRMIGVEERVVVFDPPRRCGSEVLGVRGASDAYEIAAGDGGTLITYIFRFIEPLSQAPFGGALLRRRLIQKRRKVSMPRIKLLLEERAAGSV